MSGFKYKILVDIDINPCFNLSLKKSSKTWIYIKFCSIMYIKGVELSGNE